MWKACISAKAAKALAEKYDVEMPIVMEVNKLLFENKPASEAVKDLMQRESRGKFPGSKNASDAPLCMRMILTDSISNLEK